MNGCVQVSGADGSPGKRASVVSQEQACDSILLTNNKDQSGGKSQALTLDTQKQPVNSNLIAIGKASGPREKVGTQEIGISLSHNNDERSTGEISNQAQSVLPLNAATSVAQQRQTTIPAVDGGGVQATPAGPLAPAQLQQLMLQMQMFQRSLPTGQVAAANGLPAMAPLQGGPAEQQNLMNMMMINMLTRPLADPGTIPVSVQPEVVPHKKKKHQSHKNGGAAEAQASLKRQKVESDDVILVQAKANNVDAVPLIDSSAKDDNDKSMCINIGIGPAAGGSKRKDRGSSSHSSSYASSSASRKSSDESSCEDDPSGSHSQQSGSNYRSRPSHSSQAQSEAASGAHKKKGMNQQSSSPGSEFLVEESNASKSLSEKRAKKFQGKQQVQKLDSSNTIAVKDCKVVNTSLKNKVQQESSKQSVQKQKEVMQQKPIQLDAKNVVAVSNHEQQSVNGGPPPAEDRSLPSKRQELAGTMHAPMARPRPQKILTPYEKVLKVAASEARTFNRDFDFHMRQKNREYFQSQSLLTARTERATLDSFGARKRHTQFLTNFYQHHGSSHMASSALNANNSKDIPTICLPFYNQLNMISHCMNQHQQKRQTLPSHSTQALRDTLADLQRRKDELIRQRYGLRQSQKKIYDFHLEQMEKRARNFDTFTNQHREHWNDMKDKRDSITEETRKAERELKELIYNNEVEDSSHDDEEDFFPQEPAEASRDQVKSYQELHEESSTPFQQFDELQLSADIPQHPLQNGDLEKHEAQIEEKPSTNIQEEEKVKVTALEEVQQPSEPVEPQASVDAEIQEEIQADINADVTQVQVVQVQPPHLSQEDQPPKEEVPVETNEEAVEAAALSNQQQVLQQSSEM